MKSTSRSGAWHAATPKITAVARVARRIPPVECGCVLISRILPHEVIFAVRHSVAIAVDISSVLELGDLLVAAFHLPRDFIRDAAVGRRQARVPAYQRIRHGIGSASDGLRENDRVTDRCLCHWNGPCEVRPACSTPHPIAGAHPNHPGAFGQHLHRVSDAQ